METEARNNLLHNSLRNALYHTARRRYFELLGKTTSLLIIILGASAVSPLADMVDNGTLIVSVLVTVLGAIQLVFDFSGQARVHQGLQRDYYGLMAEIEANPNPTANDIAALRGKMTIIYADEPPVMRAVDAKAYNDAIDGGGMYDGDQRLVIPFWQLPFKHFIAFEGHAYATIAERTALKG